MLGGHRFHSEPRMDAVDGGGAGGVLAVTQKINGKKITVVIGSGGKEHRSGLFTKRFKARRPQHRQYQRNFGGRLGGFVCSCHGENIDPPPG